MLIGTDHQERSWYSGSMSRAEQELVTKRMCDQTVPATYCLAIVAVVGIALSVVLFSATPWLFALLFPIIALVAFVTAKYRPYIALDKQLERERTTVRVDSPWNGTAPWAVLHKQLFARYLAEYYPDCVEAFTEGLYGGHPGEHYWELIDRNRGTVNGFMQHPDVKRICAMITNPPPEFSSGDAANARAEVDALAKKIVDYIWEVEGARRQNIRAAIQADVDTCASGVKYELERYEHQPLLSSQP